ncbi:MAG: preprotein translocase subunit SecG [Flavobacteriales bacterium]|jgi:preprotein translocase subunit SecG
MGAYTIFATLIIICSVLLVLIILIQNPKGGGLSSSFGGGASQMMGVKKTTDFLEKATWALGITMIVLILSSNFAIDRGTSEIESIGKDKAIEENMQSQSSDFNRNVSDSN